ncbi:MAG: hypothetical protein Rhims3KO_21150 [Hyphomicrobiales bacterium]
MTFEQRKGVTCDIKIDRFLQALHHHHQSAHQQQESETQLFVRAPKYTAIQSPTECSNAYLLETMQVMAHGEEISNTNVGILSDWEHQLKHDDPINQQAQKP